MNFSYYKDLISKQKAERAAAIKSNENQCKDIAEEIRRMSDMDLSFADMHGINIGYIKTVDLTKLASDSAYAMEVKQNIENEIKKITNILGGILK